MSDQDIKMYKEYNKKNFNQNKKFNKDDIEFAFSDNSTLYNSIEEGISILDTNLNIISLNLTMRLWYPSRISFVGKKCFYVYHNRKETCDNCPILKTLIDGTAHSEIIPYYIKSSNTSGWHELQSFPIMDKDTIVGIAEYVKDITFDVKLYYKIYNIEQNLCDYKEQNEILKTYLGQVENDKDEKTANILNNIKKYVKPLIKQIKNNCSQSTLDFDLISLLDSLLENISAPFLKESSIKESFTSQEIQIVSMIRGGKTSKEIADLMSLSTKTIDFHRTNIRKKLDLARTDNLCAYLLHTPIDFD